MLSVTLQRMYIHIRWNVEKERRQVQLSEPGKAIFMNDKKGADYL